MKKSKFDRKSTSHFAKENNIFVLCLSYLILTLSFSFSSFTVHKMFFPRFLRRKLWWRTGDTYTVILLSVSLSKPMTLKGLAPSIWEQDSPPHRCPLKHVISNSSYIFLNIAMLKMERMTLNWSVWDIEKIHFLLLSTPSGCWTWTRITSHPCLEPTHAIL